MILEIGAQKMISKVTLALVLLLAALMLLTGFVGTEGSSDSGPIRSCEQWYRKCIVVAKCPKDRPLKCGSRAACHSFDTFCHEKSETDLSCFPSDLSSPADQLAWCKENDPKDTHPACQYACLHRFPQLRQPTKKNCTIVNQSDCLETWKCELPLGFIFLFIVLLVLSVLLNFYLLKNPEGRQNIVDKISNCRGTNNNSPNNKERKRSKSGDPPNNKHNVDSLLSGDTVNVSQSRAHSAVTDSQAAPPGQDSGLGVGRRRIPSTPSPTDDRNNPFGRGRGSVC